MKRFMCIFSLLFLLTSWCGVDSLGLYSNQEKEIVKRYKIDENAPSGYMLFDRTPVPSKQEASFENRSDTFQLSNGRVKRLTPTFGPKPGTMMARGTFNNSIGSLIRVRTQITKLSTLDWLSLSAKYYVIALRHIIR